MQNLASFLLFGCLCVNYITGSFAASLVPFYINWWICILSIVYLEDKNAAHLKPNSTLHSEPVCLAMTWFTSCKFHVFVLTTWLRTKCYVKWFIRMGKFLGNVCFHQGSAALEADDNGVTIKLGLSTDQFHVQFGDNTSSKQVSAIVTTWK